MKTALQAFEKTQSHILWFVYFLYFLIVPAIIGLVINLIKTKQYRQIAVNGNRQDTQTLNMLQSHHQWLMRTFIVVVILTMVSIGTVYYGFGYFVAAGAIIWWFYRIVRGMLALTYHKNLPV